MGVQADIKLCNETIDYAGYDLLHFFNIIRPADILIHIQQSGLPYVVSTTFVDYSEYEKRARGGIAGLIFRIIPGDWIEYAKVWARRILNGEKVVSPSYLWLGQRRSIKKIIRGAAMLLPNSHSEYRRLEKAYGVSQRYKAIINSFDPSLFKLQEGIVRDPHLVISVGRIEGRKNQINLIKALNNTKYRLIIIGSPGANTVNYDEACKAAAASNVSFVRNIPQRELLGYYQQAAVHVLPSWFETTGLSSVEAVAMGCNIVVTDKGDTEEYFENYAWYCDPASPESIYDAVDKAASAPFQQALQHKIVTQCTWENSARQTLEAYHQVLQSQTSL